MILAIDMGNTNIVIGGIDEERTYFEERINTVHSRTSTEYALLIKDILELHGIEPSQIEGGILSSVVPLSLIHIWSGCHQYFFPVRSWG